MVSGHDCCTNLDWLCQDVEAAGRWQPEKGITSRCTQARDRVLLKWKPSSRGLGERSRYRGRKVR